MVRKRRGWPNNGILFKTAAKPRNHLVTLTPCCWIRPWP